MKTLLVTGVNSGLGRAVALAALSRGDRVIGTVRSRDLCDDFDRLSPGQSVGRLLDVRDTASAKPLVTQLEDENGPIDVLINNAGYGHEGTIEESSIEDLRRQFEVNVFGAVALIKAVLPYMRRRRHGHIINITSMAGFISIPTLGFYHGSKFALEGISETLRKEVEGLGIAVTAVAPGTFRTDWAGRSMSRTARTIDDYSDLVDPILERRRANSGKQPGDPDKAAEAILRLVDMDNRPAHLLLGRNAVSLVREKLDSLRAEIDTWEALSSSTDFS